MACVQGCFPVAKLRSDVLCCHVFPPCSHLLLITLRVVWLGWLMVLFKRCKSALWEFSLLHDVLGSVHCLGLHLHQQRVAAVRLIFPLAVKPIPKKHISILTIYDLGIINTLTGHFNRNSVYVYVSVYTSSMFKHWWNLLLIKIITSMHWHEREMADSNTHLRCL